MALNFSISPMSQNFSLNPGETTTGSITVSTPSDATDDFSYTVSVVPYNVSGEDYTIDNTTISTYSQIAQWIFLANPNGILKPGESQKIDFTINVPADIVGGSQSAALIVSPVDSGESGSGVGVTSTFSMGSVIYANISGETREGGEILANNVPNFTTSVPVSVSARLSNTGNVFETAQITISATNVFTGQSILSESSDNGNTFSEIVLPETTRLVTRQIDNLPAVGVVHLEQTIAFEGQTSMVAHNLFICPVWFLALVIAVIVAIISTAIFLVHRHRRKNTLI